MSKRLLAVLLAVAVFALSVCSVCADDSFTINEFNECRRVYAYIGSSHAYFYGYSNTTLYSARVLPDKITRSVKADGVIRSVCHDETYACALFQRNDKRYKVLKMNMNNGECIQYDVPFTEEILHKSFACADGEAVVIITSSPYSYAAGFSNGRKYTYSFSANIDCVFVNAGKLYALIYTGDIYRLSKGDKTYCTHVTPRSKPVNAGVGYVCSETGELVSLDGSERYSRSAVTVKSGGEFIEYPNGALALAALNGNTAVLKDGGACEVAYSEKEEQAAENNGSQTAAASLSSGKVAVFEAGVTVSQLKSSYSNITGVLNAKGKSVDSGALKTGYTAELTQGSCRIAVQGDVNGNGSKNSADVDWLMKHLAGCEALSECGLKAADIDGDSTADNRDLVLLAKTVN